MTNLELIDGIYFKREDQNPTGSIKDRWLSHKIDPNLKYVISSSGNAAISAQKYAKSVTIFVSSKINLDKLKLLHEYHLSPKPISEAFRYAKANRLELLRQSSDPVALQSYSQISIELLSQLPQITSLFVPVGSGTTLLGISQTLPPSVKLFAVQPASHCPIASTLDPNFISESETITDALSVRLLPLKKQIINRIKYGVVVQNADVIKNDIYHDFSPETALCIAGLKKAKQITDVGQFPVILVTAARR